MMQTEGALICQRLRNGMGGHRASFQQPFKKADRLEGPLFEQSLFQQLARVSTCDLSIRSLALPYLQLTFA
jgi:hypothetical protein